MAGDIRALGYGLWPKFQAPESAAPPIPPVEPVKCVVEWKYDWEISEAGRDEHG